MDLGHIWRKVKQQYASDLTKLTVVIARFEFLTVVWWRFKLSGTWLCVN